MILLTRRHIEERTSVQFETRIFAFSVVENGTSVMRFRAFFPFYSVLWRYSTPKLAYCHRPLHGIMGLLVSFARPYKIYSSLKEANFLRVAIYLVERHL